MIASGSTVIRRLQVRTAASDGLMVRMQTEHALQGASLQPVSLPREAMLIVRHITAKWNGRPGWDRPVRSRLDQLAREAVRPIDDPVPPNVAAVIFRDRPEFLACLAADWCAGDLVIHWWWHGLLQDRDISRTVHDAWLEMPEHIPMALQWLENKRLSADFLQKLTDNDAHTMLTTLIHTFALHNLLPLLPPKALNVSAQAMKVETRPTMQFSEAGLTSNPRLDAPWQRWIQNSGVNQLSPDRQLLLGVGLMLLNSPSIVRTTSFARQVEEWQIAVGNFENDRLISESSDSVAKQPLTSIAPVFNADDLQFDAASKIVPTVKTDQTSLTKNHDFLKLAKIESRKTNEAKNSGFSQQVATSSLSSTYDNSGNEQSTASTDTANPVESEKIVDGLDAVTTFDSEQNPFFESNEPSSRIDGEIETSTENVESTDVEIESQFGPIFYFINLGLHLELYSDFTTPLQPGIELPIWDFVALIAQQIIGDKVIHDSVWSLLARLAGRREEDLPGLHFDPPGYESLQAWLDELMSSIRPRLQSALGVNNEELPSFFMQPAHILLSSTRLDVYFSLADLPIEIRLCGLDRDPGWVPAAGRFIGFHYE